jgi:hypothetical protein
MEVNSTFYESTAIGHHYRSKKSLALAYLMTIGSKALVLTEGAAEQQQAQAQQQAAVTTAQQVQASSFGSCSPNTTDSPASSHCNTPTSITLNKANLGSVLKSFDDEAAIQRKIIHEEQVQIFQRALDDKPGVAVLKKGRNGEFRQINIRVKEDAKKGIKAVVWHSRMGGKKSFVLEPDMKVYIIKTPSESGAGLNQQKTHVNMHHHHGTGFLPNVPVLCLGNHIRQLVIQFMTAGEANVCIHLLHSLGIKDPTVATIAEKDTN